MQADCEMIGRVTSREERGDESLTTTDTGVSEEAECMCVRGCVCGSVCVCVHGVRHRFKMFMLLERKSMVL